MAGEDDVRIELGFGGGGGLSLTADKAQWEQLETALRDGKDDWVTLVAKDESRHLVNAGKVVFVRVASLSRSIGFGGK